MFMFSHIVGKMFNKGIVEPPIVKQKCFATIQENEEVELLKLKYEKLQFIEETEKEREKTVESKASMFIGSTSIMGAIIIGCANLVLDGTYAYSYVNMCVLSFMLILIYCLGCSIIYSILTLRKRKLWYLGIDDLQNTTNKKEYYTKLIDSTIIIIKHNEIVINSKVDLMQKAQQCFVSFWIWSGVFFVNLLAYHVFHAYGVWMSFETMIGVFVTLILSCIIYLILKNVVDNLKKDAGDNELPDVETEIRSVCMMMVSKEERGTE